MSDLKTCLKCLSDNYAVLFPGVDPRSVQQASVHLVKAGIPPIPLDYVAFLSETNGLSWNGMDLFSLDNIDRDKGAFYHPGILSQMAFCQNNALMKRKLLLGTGWEELLVFDFGIKQYVLLDRYTYQPVISFDSFPAVLTYIIKPIQKQYPEGLSPAEQNNP